ncbi:MAG: archaellin/type IV pilin N-terminal domain-containing protein [Sulfolobales archaeon]|nr:archaellin/type IV pilin N-terminal domain-containing protein [Sulfolobales archaeon]
MKVSKSLVRRCRRGLVGIEAAIVLIAFVLVASALAFVVLNMGMFTTQKTKEVIARAYEESTRAIDIAGNVKARTATNYGALDLVAIPIKLTAGARPIDLSKTAVAITVIFPDGNAKHTDNGYTQVTGVTFSKITDFGSIQRLSINDLQATWVYVRTDESGNVGDELLEPGEIVLLVFKAPDDTGAYSRIIVEIKPPQGSTVTVERIVPPKLDSAYVDLDIG